MDVTWRWEGEAADPAGQFELTLPTPSPEWELTSGILWSGPNGNSFAGWFDPVELEQAIDPPRDTYSGIASPEYLVLGANGATLTRILTFLAAYCQDFPREGETGILCWDSNGTSYFEYFAVPGDDAFNGPLTLTYDFNLDWEIVPLSEYRRVDIVGQAHLVYSSVPEPSTGLLVMAGLLGLTYRQRRHRQAA